MREAEVRVHANGVTGIGALTVQVADVAASLQRYAALLGQPPEAGAALSLGTTRLRLKQNPGPQGVMRLELGEDHRGVPVVESAVRRARSDRSLPAADHHVTC